MDEKKPPETFACEVREVFSGDDLILFVDLGVESLWRRQRVRLLGVDTPNAINAAEDTDAGRVRSMVRKMARGRRGLFTVHSRNMTSWVGTLVVESSTAQGGTVDLNQLLISQGHVFKRSAA